MKKKKISWLFVAALAVTSSAFAQNPKFTASRTFEYDPYKTGAAVAFWDRNSGELDNSGNTRFGLHLEKNADISAYVAAGAVLDGLKGVVVMAGDTLAYDMKNGSGGATLQDGPRFNVYYTLADGTPGNHSSVGGSGNATKTAGQEFGWMRYTLNLQLLPQANPPIPPGSVIESVTFIIDNQGVYDIDNIGFRTSVAGKPGSSN